MEEKKIESGEKKARFLYVTQIKHLFPQSTCIVPISLGQPYHEGEPFKAIMQLVNKHFKACTLIVADTLQRHTLSLYQGDLSEEALFQLALKNGEEWLMRNKEIISSMTIPCQITRWEEWRQNPEFLDKLRIVEQLHRENTGFKDALYITAQTFVDRFKKHATDLNLEKAFNQSIKYIKEECACNFLFIKKLFAFILYPKACSKAFAFFDEKLLKLQCPSTLKRVMIGFRK